MLVIVEGIDGSGKSTLCENLKQKGYKILRKERNDKQYGVTDMIRFQISPFKYVMDRALLTQWAYRLLDGKDLDKGDFDLIVTLRVLRESPVIYCNCPTAFKYSMERGETNICTLEQREKLSQIYNFIIGTLRLYDITNIYEYNFEKQTVDDVLNFIKEVKDGIR